MQKEPESQDIFKPLGRAPKRHEKRSDQIAQEVKRWTIDQGLGAGDRLPSEQDLANWFRCAKGTIREALKSLEVQGLVTMRTGPKGGPILQEPGYATASEQLRNYLNFKSLDLPNIYDMRLLIEPEMAVSVVDVVTDELLQSLKNSSSECKHHLSSTGRAVRRKELGFHIVLAQHCSNPLLAFQSLFITDLLSGFIHFENITGKGFHKFSHDNCEYHNELIKAFENRDREAVRSVMVQHMESAKAHTLKLYGKIADSLLLSRES